MSVGQRISKIRNEKGLTIKDVSIMANITPGLISQIENDKANPSLSTLLAIAKALNVDISSFFDDIEASKNSPVVRSSERQLLSSYKGFKRYLLLNSNLDKFDFNYNVLEPNATTSDCPEINLEGHTKYEFGFVIQGKLRIELEDEIYILNPGDCIFFSATKNHSVTNISRSQAEMIWLMLS